MSYYNKSSRYETEPQKRARIIRFIEKRISNHSLKMDNEIKNWLTEEEILFLRMTNKHLPESINKVRMQLFDDDLDLILLKDKEIQEKSSNPSIDWGDITENILNNMEE